MPMIKTLSVPVTAVAIQTPEKLDNTPLQGGHRRNAILDIPTSPTTAVVLIQGAGATASGVVPPPGDPAWVTLVTVNAASPARLEFELPYWIRTNVTTLHAAQPNLQLILEGVQ